MKNQFNTDDKEVKQFVELENELQIEILEERLEMTTDGEEKNGGPNKLPDYLF